MKDLFSEMRGAIMATVILAVVCCGLYPLVVFGIGQICFKDKANGSLIVDKDGTIQGSTLIGQNFTQDKYFHPRPSAAGNGYDATSSGGSNLGPTSQKLNDQIKQNIADYRSQNGMDTNAVVPADAVTASGSGLDPHISLHNAELQAPRVAKARGIALEKVMELVRVNTDAASLGILGEPGVNVLKLNLALDDLERFKKSSSHSASVKLGAVFLGFGFVSAQLQGMQTCAFAEASPQPKNPRSEWP